MRLWGVYMNEDFFNPKEVIELGHYYHAEIPHHPFHSPFVYSLSRMHGDTQYDNGITTANDLITLGTHTGTHIDALGHVACNGYFHNGIEVKGNQSKTKGVSVYGVEQIAPIITKAKLLDIPTAKGLNTLEYAYKISVEDIQHTLEKQSMEINFGDAVFIRTGWGAKFSEPVEFLALEKGVPGMTLEAVDYLLELGMSLTGSDTTAYEVMEGKALPVHHRLLVEKGIHIIEMMNFEELTKQRLYQFKFLCLPLRIVGGTGSPVRPVAII